MNEFIDIMESNNEDDEMEKFYKKYGPSPLLRFVAPFIENNEGIEEIRKALEKETDISDDYIPQDMNDRLQQILGCGKYAGKKDTETLSKVEKELFEEAHKSIFEQMRLK